MKRVVLLLSGGFDSTSLLCRLVSGCEVEGDIEIYPVFINYGQHTARDEFFTVCAILSRLKKTATAKRFHNRKIMPLISDVTAQVGRCTIKDQYVQYEGKHPAYVPYRNLVLLSLALSVTEEIEPDYIMMGVHNIDVENRFPDCSGDFAEVMQHVVDMYTGSRLCEVVFPFCCDQFRSKDDIKKYIFPELLDLCFSGYGETLAAKLTTSENTLDDLSHKLGVPKRILTGSEMGKPQNSLRKRR